jgi:hypothetical protein
MKRILLICAGIGFTAGLFSQTYTSIHYDISVPFGASADQTGKTSFRGAGIDFANLVTPRISLGFHLSMATFYEKLEDGRIEFTQGVITGKQYRYLNAIPMYVSTRYMLNKGNWLPFFGLGVGTMWSEGRTDMGLYSGIDKAWRFAVSPEAGIILGAPEYDLGLNLGIRYNYGFKTSGSLAEQYLSFVIGVTLLGGY